MHGKSTEQGEDELWERLPFPMFRATTEGRVQKVNAAFVACVRGTSAESLLGTPADDLFVDPGEAARWAAIGEAGGPALAFTTQIRRLDGTVFWARTTAQALRNRAGAVVSHEVLVEGAGPARLGERQLLASELRYRRLFEAARDGILILDAASAEILDVNPYLCELLALSRAEVLGRKLWEIGPFKDVPASKANFRELQSREYIRYEDLPLETASGARIAVEFVSNLYNADGESVIQCNVRDITQRNREAEMRAVLTRAVEQAAESIVITDRAASIVYVNPAFETLSGWTSAEALGQNPRILKSEQQGAAFYRQMWEVLAGGGVWTGRMVNRRKDGMLYEEVATISPVRDAAGEIVNYVAVKRDVTEEVRLERQLVQAQKMEAVGRLAGGIAHDFNNLLGVVSGYGEVVHGRLPAEDPLRPKMEHLLRAAERAAGLTRQLLAFSREQVLRPQVLELNAVVGEVTPMLERLIGEDVELSSRLDPAAGNVKADPGQLEQVLMNLAANARDAMPEGGRLLFETANVELDEAYAASHPPARPGRYVLLTISDTGTGMDAETQARIFEPFFSTKEVGRGTGLGLATVYGIVRQSEGYIWVYSELGVGTTFKVYLPRVDEAAPVAPHARPLPLPRGSETVLLVEDEASLRELLREGLEESGYTVLTARDGAEGLQVAEGHAGALALMVSDVIMPGMTGPRLVELLARVRPQMKVLYISGYSEEAVSRHGLLGPGAAFLTKPFGLGVFLRRVRESLDGA